MVLFIAAGVYTGVSDQLLAKKHNCSTFTPLASNSSYIKCYGKQIGGGSNSNWKVVEK